MKREYVCLGEEVLVLVLVGGQGGLVLIWSLLNVIKKHGNGGDKKSCFLLSFYVSAAVVANDKNPQTGATSETGICEKNTKRYFESK